jgi:hypothetical protein
MQLAIKDAIESVPEIKDLISTVSSIATHFKRASGAKRVFEIIKEKHKVSYSIFQNVKTRLV